MNNGEKTCSFRSDCWTTSNSEYRDALFKDNWEVFVIRHDKNTGKLDWFTECCERIINRFVKNAKSLSAHQIESPKSMTERCASELECRYATDRM